MEKRTLITFSQALKLLKSGKKVTRAKWDGKNQYLVLRKGKYDFPQDEETHVPENIDGYDSMLFEHKEGGVAV